MSRHERMKSASGYYHIMLRGNERKGILIEEEDKRRFIETLYERRANDRFHLHAFCLMDNHVHLMLSEGMEEIAKVMKRIRSVTSLILKTRGRFLCLAICLAKDAGTRRGDGSYVLP